MPPIINPFDAGGYSLAEMTDAINILPNEYGVLNQLGLFKPTGVSSRSVIIEQRDGQLALLPTVHLGGPATMGQRDKRSMRSFSIPHIPHDDVITPQDIQGVRGFGQGDSADPLATVMNRILEKMRLRHRQTLEYMRIQALKGILKDGANVTLYNYFTEFGITQKSVDFVLGTGTTDVGAKCREVMRHVEQNLKGETMTGGVLALVDPSFWDKLVKHTAVVDAFKYYTTLAAQQPLRDDVRSGFRFHGITFREYNATFTLADGTTSATAFAADDGVAFPLGTTSAFETFNAPANLVETVNTIGLEMYARQVVRQDGRGIDVFTEANPLPIVKRPALVVRVYSSN